MPVRKTVTQLQRGLQEKIDNAGDFYLEKVYAEIGNHQGVVAVPNTQSMIYVRLANGQVISVFNNVAPNIYNWKVYIGRDKSQPSLLKVVESRWVYNAAQTVAYVLFHHSQHEYPNADTVWIRRDQFMPLLVLPLSGLSIRLFGDMIYRSGMDQPIRVADQDIDLTSHALSVGAKYELLEVLADGTINYVVGATYGSRLELYETDYPVPSAGAFPIAVLVFHEGQTEFRRDSDERTIIDLRMFTSDATAVGTQIVEADETTAINDADFIGYYNSGDSVLKKISLLNLKDNIYQYVHQLYAVLRFRIAGLPVNPDLPTTITDAQTLVWDAANNQFTNVSSVSGTTEPSLYVYMGDNFTM